MCGGGVQSPALSRYRLQWYTFHHPELNHVVPAQKTPLAVCFGAGTSWGQQGSERTHSVLTQVVTTTTHCGLHKKMPREELCLWKFNVKFSSKISVGNGYLLGTQVATIRGLSSGAVPHSAHLACRIQTRSR